MSSPNGTGAPLGPAGRQAMFLVWGPPSHGPRSRVFSSELGIDVEFVFSTRRRGLLVAPFKYAHQAFSTLMLLARRRPRVVFVQSPPSFAVLCTALYATASGAGYIVDAHSDAMLSPWWTRPRWLHRLLSRRALATIVTNRHFADLIRSWGGRALVVPDIPTEFPQGATARVGAGFNVMVVNTFASDEPVEAILGAAGRCANVRFHLTGDPRRAVGRIEGAPPNVRFTGFLPDEDYYALMAASDAVMCLTTRNHTMQRGACEALSIGKPIVTSDWPLLREYFHMGAVHVDNTEQGIADGVRDARDRMVTLRNEISALQADQRATWEGALTSLVELTGDALRPMERSPK